VNGQWVGAGSTLTAVNAVIDSGSSISANEQGYTGVNKSNGNGPGGGYGGNLHPYTCGLTT